MMRLIYNDTRRLFTNRNFRLCLLINVGYELFLVVGLKVILYFFLHESIHADEVAFNYNAFAIFLLTASTLLTTISDFTDGGIRNKLISGANRRHIVLSSLFTGMLQGVIHSFVACITSIVVCWTMTDGYQMYNAKEVADYWLVMTLGSMAIGVLSTALIMMLGGRKSCYVVGLSIAFAMRIYSAAVISKLYPDKGMCKLTGAKLALYRFSDRYVPYLFISMRPHWDFGSYIIGSAGVIFISMFLALVIFNKKELK